MPNKLKATLLSLNSKPKPWKCYCIHKTLLIVFGSVNNLIHFFGFTIETVLVFSLKISLNVCSTNPKSISL